MYMQGFFDIFLPQSMIFYLIEIKSTKIDWVLKTQVFVHLNKFIYYFRVLRWEELLSHTIHQYCL